MVSYLDSTGLSTLVSNVKTLHKSHADRRDNPHEVTTEQLGIEKVENKSSADIRSEITAEDVENALGFKPVSGAGGGQSDWNETDSTSLAFINNKPESLPASDVYEWAKAEEKPEYTAEEVGADAVGTAETKANAALDAAKQYADTQDEGNLALAKSYSDTNLAAAKSYTDEAYANGNLYTDTKIADLINGAPTTLDTLGEIATAMADNADVVEALETAIGNKVDKVSGKGLSTNDYTTTEKNKLAGIEANANNYTHPNSGVTAGTYRSVTVNAAGHVTAGSNPTITVAQGGTGKTTARDAFSALSKINSGGDWKTAPTGISVWKYEGHNVTDYSLPNNCCFILVMKESNNRGTALALGWTTGTYTMWRSILHDDTGSNKWGAWSQPYTAGTGLSLSGTAFSVTYGTAAGTACQGNDSRLSNARPANGGTATNAHYAGTTAPGTASLKNTYAGTADMTPGVTKLATGTIYLVYE